MTRGSPQQPLSPPGPGDADLSPAIAQLEARVTGVVQGVGFRWFVVQNARRLGLVGWVRNQTDGSVALVAEGSTAALDALEQAIHVGPSGAHVATVTATRGSATGRYARFELRSGTHPGD